MGRVGLHKTLSKALISSCCCARKAVLVRGTGAREGRWRCLCVLFAVPCTRYPEVAATPERLAGHEGLQTVLMK